MLAARVLPMYFVPKGSTKAQKDQDDTVRKYPSFKQKLNCWGFRQVTQGLDKGAIYHKLFLRDEPEACRNMVCQKSMKKEKGCFDGINHVPVIQQKAILICLCNSITVKDRCFAIHEEANYCF